jgi:hypothetical protein
MSFEWHIGIATFYSDKAMGLPPVASVFPQFFGKLWTLLRIFVINPQRGSLRKYTGVMLCMYCIYYNR